MRIVLLSVFYARFLIGQESALAHAEHARQLTIAAKYAEAILEWKEAIRLSPSNAVFHNLYGLALQQSGAPGAAQNEFRLALHFKPELADAQSNLAFSLWQDRQYAQAAAETDRAIHLSPADGSLHLLRGQLYARSQDHVSACREFGLSNPWPAEPSSLWEIMDNCASAGNRQLAIRAASLLPPDAETQLIIGRWFLAANQPGDAVAFLERASASGNLREQALLSLADAYLAGCQASKALTVLSQMHQYEDQYQVLDRTGSALLALGREEEAEKQLAGLVEKFPDLPAAYVAATQVALQQKRWDDAIQLLNSGLIRMPDDWLLLFRRGVVYKLSGHVDAARNDFMNSLRQHGQVVLVAAALGDLEAENGNLPGAAALFKRTWLETGLPQFQFAYALALDRLGDTQAAMTELADAARRSPKDAQVHYTLGKMLARANRLAEAQSQFEQTRQLAPGLAVNLYALGHAYLAQGEAAKAKEVMSEFQKAKLQAVPGACKPL